MLKFSSRTRAVMRGLSDRTRELYPEAYARHAIWKVLRDGGAYLDLSAISLSSDINPKTCRKVLKQMIEEGFVEQTGETYQPTWREWRKKGAKAIRSGS